MERFCSGTKAYPRAGNASKATRRVALVWHIRSSWADGIAKWREWSNMTCGCDDIQVEVDFYQGATEGDWCAHIQDRPGGYAYTCATAAELIRCLELDRLLNPDYWVGGTENTFEDVRNFVASRPGEIPDRMFGLADSLGNVRPIP